MKKLDTSELGPISVIETPRVVRVEHRVYRTELGSRFCDPREIDVIEWQGFRFVKERR